MDNDKSDQANPKEEIEKKIKIIDEVHCFFSQFEDIMV